MKPEDVERLLGNLEPAPPPERLEHQVLGEGAKMLRRDGGAGLRPTRPSREGRGWGIAGVAAACLLLSVVLWRVLVPQPGDPDPCLGAIEFETHLDKTAAAGPPAFLTDPLSREAYGPLLRRADAVKPLARELHWQRIPWVTDLEEAQRMARTERRPLFLWVSNHDPMERCCGCAAGLRAGPLSQEDVVRSVSGSFVPAAVDKKALINAKGKGEEYIRSLQRQKPQYHGIWIVSPEGKVLAGHGDPKAKDMVGWTREILETLEAGLKAFGPVSPRRVQPVDRLPYRGRGVGPEGSVNLAFHSRLMHKGARDGPVVFDSVTLSAQEWAMLLPPRMEAGEEWVVPDAVARKLCGTVSPVSDPAYVPRPEHVKAAELRATVALIQGGIAELRFIGRWEIEQLIEKKTVRASASGEGLAIVELPQRTMRSFLLVTTGIFSSGETPASGTRETGAVLEWSATTR